jgi:hypothetical protein
MAIVHQITAAYQDWRYGNRIRLSAQELQALLKQLRQKDWRKISYTQVKP